MNKLVLDESFTIPSEILINDDYCSADEGSVEYQLFNCIGELSDSGTGLSLPVVITADKLTVDSSVTHEHYQLRVTFKEKGENKSKQYHLRVGLPIVFGFSETDVLEELGLGNSMVELDINLYKAYDQVSDAIDKLALKDRATHALESELIKLKAKINILPSISLIMLKTVKVDDQTETRFDLDLDKIELDLKDEYQIKLRQITGESYNQEPLMAVVATTDIITGQ